MKKYFGMIVLKYGCLRHYVWKIRGCSQFQLKFPEFEHFFVEEIVTKLIDADYSSRFHEGSDCLLVWFANFGGKSTHAAQAFIYGLQSSLTVVDI